MTEADGGAGPGSEPGRRWDMALSFVGRLYRQRWHKESHYLDVIAKAFRIPGGTTANL
jgi:hypothetical protein